MRYYSTKNKKDKVSLKEAVTRGLAPDGGLYMPESIPQLPAGFFKTIRRKSLQQIAYTVAKAFVGDEISGKRLKQLVDETLNFPIPLVPLEARLQPKSPESLLPVAGSLASSSSPEARLPKLFPKIYALELFHGPTMAFKDVGARFMARLLAALRGGATSDLTVLVATSGDTGSAVASGFYNVPGIKVVILYPSKRVSDLQEK